MGNNHCQSSYSRNNWEEYQGGNCNDRYHDNSTLCHSNPRTNPSFTGAIGRFVGAAKSQAQAARQEAKELRRHAKERAKEMRHQARDLRRSRKHGLPIGTNTPVQIGSGTSGSQHQPQMPQYAPNPRHNMVTPGRGDDVENDPITICEYCDDMIMSQFYEEHIAYCGPNAKKDCEFCGQSFRMKDLVIHKQACDAKIENIRINCDYCQNKIALVDHHYHMSICAHNPYSMRQNNKAPVEEVNECAICLLEIKKDSDVKFLHCAHNFHTNCIEEWSQKKKTCPVCMTDFN